MIEPHVVEDRTIVRHIVSHEIVTDVPDKHYIGAPAPTPTSTPTQSAADTPKVGNMGAIIIIVLVAVLAGLLVWLASDRGYFTSRVADNQPVAQQPAPVPAPIVEAPAVEAPAQPPVAAPVPAPVYTTPLSRTPRAVSWWGGRPLNRAWLEDCANFGGWVYRTEDWKRLRPEANVRPGALHCNNRVQRPDLGRSAADLLREHFGR